MAGAQIEGSSGKVSNTPNDKKETSLPSGDLGSSYNTITAMKILENNRKLFEWDNGQEGLYGGEKEPVTPYPGSTPLG
jgi:hypothetical protein